MLHNSTIQTRIQQTMAHVFAIPIFCAAEEIMFFTFLYCWGENSKEEYCITCKYFRKV